MDILSLLGKKLVFFDGGMGALLQEKGLKPGELPEIMNITNPDVIMQIHCDYYNAGSDIITTNTFGANRIKLKGSGYDVETIVSAAVNCAAKARKSINKAERKYIALDIGPTGKLLQPAGDLSFNQAYESFKEVAILGEKYGADLAIIETMMDPYEMKAAVLAVKENTNLPIFATFTFDENGKLLTGGDISVAVSILEGLCVDALGINCSFGPDKIKEFVKEISEFSSTPIVVNPNAGIPKVVEGRTVYDVSPESFAEQMKEIVAFDGVCVVGGCCGTTPRHISKMVESCKNVSISKPLEKNITIISSYNKSQEIGKKPVIIGERINPTGKKKFKEALKNNDIDYIVEQGILQKDAGADILDVNVGLPEINEKDMMLSAIANLQASLTEPLQIDTSDSDVMEEALRIYNGKALINSVNGKEESMNTVFPLVKKYGGVVVALTLDEDGIPETAQGRLVIAEKIVKTAEKFGIAKKDIIIDPLTLTISAIPDAAKVTLESIRLIKEKLNVNTILGVSNVSFGLPNREIINSSFFSLALATGLDCAIINPCSEKMMQSYYSFNALMGDAQQCDIYIEKYSNIDSTAIINEELTLKSSIKKGLDTVSSKLTEELLKNNISVNEIIENEIVKALEDVGIDFEANRLFLPQLLKSAKAAQASFDIIKNELEQSGNKMQTKGRIILATVEGDIHDIGKNIVKVMLENYGFDVLDLGKDVKPELIADIVEKENIKLVGLSALMTTTVPSMKRTIDLLRERKLDCRIMVGGAVLTQEYADEIKADYYCKDAMESVKIAQNIF